jgi:hypothetical protein
MRVFLPLNHAPLPFPRLILPAALYPVLLPNINVRDPVDEKGKLRTLN